MTRSFLIGGGETAVRVGDGHVTLMGVVNRSVESRNRDTFVASPQQAVERARRLRAEGAELIDVGGQSTTAPTQVELSEELQRVVPTVEALVEAGFVVSVDTWRPAVAEAALRAGAQVLNDTGGLQDPEMLDVAARHRPVVVAMYLAGTTPLDVGGFPLRAEEEAATVLRKRVRRLVELGLERVLIDPGIGITYRSYPREKAQAQVGMLRSLAQLRSLGHPLLVPVPRKPEPSLRAAFTALAVEYGADVLRVHDVAEAAAITAVLGRRR